MLKEWKAEKWWNNPSLAIWGGGHTVETDPTRKGWRAKPLGSGSDFVLVGRPGVEGCFSAQVVRAFVPGVEAYIDLAIYLDTPSLIAKDRPYRVANAIYHRIAACPGWGLRAIELLEAEMAASAQYGAAPC